MSRIERTITRETGERVRIILYYAIKNEAMSYKVKSHLLVNMNQYKGNDVATPSEIHSVKLELWEKLKPVE